MIWIAAIGLVLVTAVVIYDLTQRQHAILRTFPVVGHFRYWLEAVGPELRQYIVTDNDEERPFSRDHRRTTPSLWRLVIPATRSSTHRSGFPARR